MSVEHIHMVKRTIWVAKCPGCEDSVERTDSPARERFCNSCKAWVPFVEQSATSPEYAVKPR